MSLKRRSQSVPEVSLPAYTLIVEQTNRFCQAHLNEECAALCRELAGALARKRPSPIGRGQPVIWAAGIISALALVNFWYDRTQTPHTSHAELCEFFQASSSTVSAKSKQIRNLFRMHHFDPDWTLPSKLDKNPLIWMVSVNGLIVDIRHMPPEVQALAYAKGIIPYIPADQLPAEEVE